MPTYQYRCTECGEGLEAVQKFSDAPLTICPNCGGPLRKVFNAVGVVFRGSGFYRTDSRNGSKNGERDSGPAEKKSDAETKTTKESAGSTASGSSSNGKQSTTSEASSTGQKAGAK
jgi:putative FmdB family regulatory protein